MINDKKVSVVMATYNGEKYVVKQLESIYNQTRRPDEVVICDDGSTDNTVSLVKDFILSKGLENWSIEVNSPNLGWKANFYKATSLASGDIIFFSDQDDIWNEGKIEMMSKLMIEKKMGALYATKTIIDSEGKIMAGRQEKTKYTGDITRIELSPSFYEVKTLGCCMCINSDIANIYRKVGYDEGDHDSQCGRLAVLCSSLWYLDLPVINYRIHSTNSSGISSAASYGQSSRSVRVREIESYIRWMDKVEAALDLDTYRKVLLEDCKAFLKRRLGFFKGTTSFLFLLKNLKYYTGMTMLAGDLAYKYGINKKAGKVFWYFNKLKHQ